MPIKHKRKKQDGELELKLAENPDILKTLGQKKGRRVLVGFAAETRNLEEYAKEKIAKKNLDLIVVNDVSAPGAGFDVDTNIITIFTPEGEKTAYRMMSKREAADIILDRMLEILKSREREITE